MNRSELQKEIIKKIMADESFKAEFLKSPKETVGKLLGIKLPDATGINVVEEDANTISIILPKNISELSDSDLDNVAGGCGFYVGCEGYCPADYF